MQPPTEKVLLRRVVFRAALALGSVALTILVLEIIGAVGFHYAKRKPPLPPEVRATVAVDDRSVETVPDPYLLLRVKPDALTPHARTNRFGLRNDPIDAKPLPGTLRVLFLGGSVTWGYAARANEETLPALLEGYLSRHRDRSAALRGKRIEVLNGGVPSYNAWQAALSYALYHRSLSPDVIISLDGTNDVDGAVRTGRAGWPMRYAASRSGHRVSEPTLAGSLWEWLGFRVQRMKFNRMLETLRPRPLAHQRPPSAEAVADAYRSALEHLADVATRDGAVVIPMLQPMSILEGVKPLAPYESAIARHHEARMPGVNDYYQRCFEAFRRMFRELASERPELAAVDATTAFSDLDEVAFTDHCHLTLRGREHLVRLIGDTLIARLDREAGRG